MYRCVAAGECSMLCQQVAYELYVHLLSEVRSYQSWWWRNSLLWGQTRSTACPVQPQNTGTNTTDHAINERKLNKQTSKTRFDGKQIKVNVDYFMAYFCRLGLSLTTMFAVLYLRTILLSSVTTELNVARICVQHSFSGKTHRRSPSWKEYTLTRSTAYCVLLHSHYLHCKV